MKRNSNRLENAMDIIFLRINDDNFKLLPTRSCSSSEIRLLREVRREVEDYLGKQRFFDRNGLECGKTTQAGHYCNSNWEPAQKIVEYAQRYQKYRFWKFLNIPTEVFTYDSTDKLLKKIVDESRLGITMGTAVQEIKQHLKWQELTRCI
jgi:hypothetical protein